MNGFYAKSVFLKRFQDKPIDQHLKLFAIIMAIMC